MLKRAFATISAGLALLCVGGALVPALAQDSYTPDRYFVGERGRFFFEPTVGYAFYGDLAHIPAIRSGSQENTREGIVYDLKDGLNVGFRLGWNFSNWLGVQAGISYGPTELEYLFGGEELESSDLLALGGNLTPPSTGLPVVDVYRAHIGIDLNWTFPDVPRIVPTLGLGAAAVRYQMETFRPPTHRDSQTTTQDIAPAFEGTDYGVYFIGGIQIGVSDHMSFGLELQNYTTKFHLKDNQVVQGVDAINNSQTVVQLMVILQI
jgi:opacity protein-like surface antigen